MTRDAAGRCRVAKRHYQNDRQTLIVEAPTAIGDGGCIAEADGAGVEVWSAGKNPSAKRFQPIAEFVDFVGTDGARVRERDELHARGRERVEPGTGRRWRSGQGKRLDAVTEKVASGKGVVGLMLWSTLAIKLVKSLYDGETTEAVPG